MGQQLSAEGRRRAQEAARIIPGYNAFAEVERQRQRAEQQRRAQAPVSPYEARRRAAEREAMRQRRLQFQAQQDAASGRTPRR